MDCQVLDILIEQRNNSPRYKQPGAISVMWSFVVSNKPVDPLVRKKMYVMLDSAMIEVIEAYGIAHTPKLTFSQAVEDLLARRLKYDRRKYLPATEPETS